MLDVQMPGLTGFEIARRLLQREAESHLVFVTAYDRHAIEAFDVKAVDYLLIAAEEASRALAEEQAVGLYNQALELIPEEDTDRRREVNLKRAVSYARYGHMFVGDASG